MSRWIVSWILSCLTAVQAGVLPTTNVIYVIRHGEKTSAVGCLDTQGKERANNIVDVFNGTRFSTPHALFANYYDDKIDCERCLQTVQPIAAKLNLTIDHTHGYNFWTGGNKGAAKAMKAKLKTAGVVLTAWEHINIQYLVEALGVDKSKVPHWSGSDYDSIYVLHFDDQQNLLSFDVAHEDFKLPYAADVNASCAKDVAAAAVSIGTAALHIKAAVSDCSAGETDPTKCAADVAGVVSALGAATADISGAVGDCGGAGSSCAADVGNIADVLGAAASAVSSAVNDCKPSDWEEGIACVLDVGKAAIDIGKAGFDVARAVKDC